MSSILIIPKKHVESCIPQFRIKDGRIQVGTPSEKMIENIAKDCVVITNVGGGHE